MFKIRMRSALKAAVLICVLAAYVLLAYSLSRHTAYYSPYRLSGNDKIAFEKAKVVSVNSESVKKDDKQPGLVLGSQNVTVKVLTGEYKGKNLKVVNNLNYDTDYYLKPGQGVIVTISTTGTGGTMNVNINSPSRTPWLYLMAALFVLLLCLVGGKRGFKSVVGIIFTLTSLVFVFVPLLYNGVSPVLAALSLAAATSCVTLLLTGGVERKSFIAILGTVGGVAVSALIEHVFASLSHTSGYTFGDTDSLLAISSHSGLKVGELMFAAVLISSLGAVMDISISVASSVNEVCRESPASRFRELFFSGMNVGRDMMGTMANTLILAFGGTSLVTLIEIYTYNMYYYQVMNSNGIAVEIIEALTGSIGVILTVPLVSFLCAKLLPRRGKTPEN